MSTTPEPHTLPHSGQQIDEAIFATMAQQLDATLIEQAMALITPAQRIALLAHEHPDGDCLGAILGFALILRQLGKECVPVCADPTPRSFTFLPGVETLQNTLGDERFDLVIALDANALSRYGTVYTQHQHFLDHAPILNIDHHTGSKGCGKVNIIDPDAASTTELVTLVQQQAHLPLPKEAAICLLTGLITDTGSFQYTNTTPRAMIVGALLTQHGAVAEDIVKPIFRTEPLAQARFMATAINNAQCSPDGRVIWSYATQETLKATGATPDMDDNASSRLRDIEGVKIAIFFKSYQDPSITNVSMRSSAPYDVAAICARLGGGGHPRAAGARLQQPLQEAIPHVLAEIERAMRETDRSQIQAQ